MMTDFLFAYWLHSTAMLASTWCVMKIARAGSSVLRERLWRLAAVLPVLTAVVAAVMLPFPTTLTASVPRPSENGLHVDQAQHGSLPGSRGSVLIREIETELKALRSELIRAEQLAEQQSDPKWLDAVEQLRDREQQLVGRWRVLLDETGPAQETGTLIDADLH